MAKSNKTYHWNARDYAQHSQSQYEWALALIEKLELRGDETVLDIGSGDGKVSTALADRLPQGQVIGIDSSAEMIALAKRRHGDNSKSRLRFIHQDIRNLDENNRFDVVFSNAALHWVKNHAPVLVRVSQAMKPGGRLLFQMGGKGNAAQVIAILERLIQANWQEYFSGFTFPYGFHGTVEYTQWLKKAGLQTLRATLIVKDMCHDGRKGLAGWIRTTWLPYLEQVPMDLREAFIAELTDEYLRRYPPDHGGNVHVSMVRLEVEAVKPHKRTTQP